MIYTSYFSNHRKFPDNAVPISIALFSPSWMPTECYSKLAPSKSILNEYKSGIIDERHYSYRFIQEILHKLSAEEVEKELYRISNFEDVILLCYERPADFCHRKLVSGWLRSNGIECKELEC